MAKLLLNKEGKILASNGKILMVKKESSSGGSGGVIEVDTLPEVGEEGNVYKLEKVNLFVNEDGFCFDILEYYISNGANITLVKIEERPANPIISYIDTLTMYGYYIVSENDIKCYIDLGNGLQWCSIFDLISLNKTQFKGEIVDNTVLTTNGDSGVIISEALYLYESDWVKFVNEPSGTLEITTTAEVDVSKYSLAKIVDSNLVAENIKKDVSILGVTGTFENLLQKRFNAQNGYGLFAFSKGFNLDEYMNNLDLSGLNDCRYMFYMSHSVTKISQLDTSNVTNMEYMFYDCLGLYSIPQIDTSNVTSTKYMFSGCSSFMSIPQIDTSNVTSMEGMFSNCYNLETIDITSMDGCPNETRTDNFASNCYALTKLIIRTMTVIPSLSTNSFNNCYHFTGTVNSTYNPEGLKDGRIYVPDNMVDSLKSATNWSKYADIIVPLSTLQEE